MTRTRLQIEADRHSADVRQRLAEDYRRLREDAGATRAAVAGLAGLDPTVIARIEDGSIRPTVETYGRVAAALGADFTARIYPQSGPAIHDRHQAPMADVVIAATGPRWRIVPEVAVRRPVRGWIDLVLLDQAARLAVCTELESDLRRIEQLIRWSAEKAAALGSSALARAWPGETGAGVWAPTVSRLLVVRWTRANREAVAATRRLVREAFPADPVDALDALSGSAAWPGPALLWARVDRGQARLVP